MKLSTRDLATIAVFGALWGVVEISLGTYLKSMRIPLSGAILAAVGLFILLVGRVFVPRRGASLFTGIIALLVKLFSLGGIIIGPMIGIFAEAIIAECVLTLAGQPKRPIFLLAGSLGVLWALIQPFFTGLLLWGREPFVVWLDLLDSGSRLLGLPTNAAIGIALGLVLIHILLGGLAGWLAWDVGRQLMSRLGKRS